MNNELLVIYKSVLSTLQNYLASFYDDLLMIHEEVIIEDSFDKLTSFFGYSAGSSLVCLARTGAL